MPIDGMPKTLFTLSKIQTMDPDVTDHPPPEHADGKPQFETIQTSVTCSPSPDGSGARPRNAPPERFVPLRGTGLTGGADRDRTDDLLLAKQALSQLSYGPAGQIPAIGSRRIAEWRAWPEWWAWEDLNFRPHAYQACALTS